MKENIATVIFRLSHKEASQLYNPVVNEPILWGMGVEQINENSLSN